MRLARSVWHVFGRPTCRVALGILLLSDRARRFCVLDSDMYNEMALLPCSEPPGQLAGSSG